jgi:hypothetical protein
LGLLAQDPAGPAALRLGDREWPDVFRFLHADVELESQYVELDVDDRLSWAALVQVLDAMHDTLGVDLL